MPPKTSGKAAAKSGKAAVAKGDKKKKKKGKRKESYAIYIYKVELLASQFLHSCAAGLEASSSRHWGFLEGHVYHELFCQ